MSTDITRGPKICPNCGKKNQPAAAQCWLCFTPLDGTDQTTTAPAPGGVRLSAPPHSQPNCATAALWVILTIVAAFVTFFLVCAANMGGHP
jgi:hypothetical protein